MMDLILVGKKNLYSKGYLWLVVSVVAAFPFFTPFCFLFS